MLTELTIENLALVDKLQLEFGPGLNVITGETGAGKSVLMGALNLLLGGRADKTMIRDGAEACVVEATFFLAQPTEVNAILAEADIAECEEGQLLVRRVLKADGANLQKVNNSSATLKVLKQLGELLLDMHGPHDHQSLLRPDAQLQLLDAFGETDRIFRSYQTAYLALNEVASRISALQEMGEDVQDQLDLLSYRVKEMEEAALVVGEEEAVREEHEKAVHAQDRSAIGQGLLQALTDGEGCAADGLRAATGMLQGADKFMAEAETWREQIQRAFSQVQELSAVVAQDLQSLEGDPERLTWLDQRLAVYYNMKKKYGGSVEAVLEQLEGSRQQLHDLENREAQLEKLEAKKASVLEQVRDAGRKLHKIREKAAKQLAVAITQELQSLGFAKGRFEIEVTESDPKATGLDEVEFGFAPNPGETMRPLRAIASSGEMSRVMLAAKAILARHDQVPVQVFDEIDANIGGETGSAVGKKLAEVGRSHQIMCITHLPQVAIYGAAHYAVSKHEQQGRTVTQVRQLDEQERVDEVARMLGGRDLTSVTVKHAREMLKQVAV